ncbi:hypothetical protein [Cytobacillus sp.]|uniref:hypothetical protein n=1 Tax=Cytobacillus sp. TaxID=2675269 RepID=UPI0028BD7524|nr:hypothetical protein [Cytobacillus sp.]
MHIIIYRKSDGQSLLQETASSFFTQETYDSTHNIEHVVKTHGGVKEDYSEIRLVDETIIQKTVTHEFTIVNGEIVFGAEKVIEAPPKEPTPDERIKALEEERLGLQLALAESIEKQEIDKINNQLALAELVETLTMKGVL